MEILKSLIKEIKNGEILTDDYAALQEAALEISTKKVEFGQCQHSELGTPNKFVIGLPEAIESEGFKFKALTFIDDSSAIYLKEDFDTALKCAEVDGWFEEYSRLNLAILDSIIFDNREYVEKDGRSTEEYYLEDFEEHPEGWDCVFPFCPNWFELDEYHRKYRAEAFKEALNYH